MPLESNRLLRGSLNNVKKDTCIELDLVQSDHGLGIEIRNVVEDNDWSHGRMIFPVKGIFSYTIETCSNLSPTSIVAGWTNKCDLDKGWTSNPADDNRNGALDCQWPNSIFSVSTGWSWIDVRSQRQSTTS